MEKKLLRSASNKVIGGVCGGIGEYCNVDPTVIRVLYAVLTLSACASKPQVGTFGELPAAAQTFVTTHFSESDIALILWEQDGLHKEYEVRLNNGTQIEFDGKGQLEKIDSKPNAVPAGIVPEAITTYVSTKFPQAAIVEYSIDRRKQETELSNGLDLVFDLQGNFMHIDD